MDVNSIFASKLAAATGAPQTANSASSASSATGSTSRTVTTSLGKDEFLQLLVAQLQNQDPTSPMDNTEFIAQMAQFSALEQMQQLSKSFTYSQAYSLVGKMVSADITNDDGTISNITGTVGGVTTVNDTPYLYIGGNLVSMDTPITVIGAGMDESLLQGASMIGKYITGNYLDQDNNIQSISGTVDRVTVVDGEPVLYVGSQAVRLSNVTEVRASAPAQA